MVGIEPGVIRNREYATRVRDFSGLRFGTITPTDLDGLIEYKDRGYVLIEVKYGETRLPDGQRLALERLCDDLQKTKPALLVIGSHHSRGDIDVAQAVVTEYRYNTQWRERESRIGPLVAGFLEYLDRLYSEEWQGRDGACS